MAVRLASWLRRRGGRSTKRFEIRPDEHAERVALAERLRRELVPLEAALARAAERLEQATTDPGAATSLQGAGR